MKTDEVAAIGGSCCADSVSLILSVRSATSPTVQTAHWPDTCSSFSRQPARPPTATVAQNTSTADRPEPRNHRITESPNHELRNHGLTRTHGRDMTAPIGAKPLHHTHRSE